MTDAEKPKKKMGRPPVENPKQSHIHLRVHKDVKEKFIKLGGTPWFERQVETAQVDEGL